MVSTEFVYSFGKKGVIQPKQVKKFNSSEKYSLTVDFKIQLIDLYSINYNLPSMA